MVIWNNHNSAWVLPCCSFYACTSSCQTGNFRIMSHFFILFKIFKNKAISCFVCQSTYCTCFECFAFAEKHFRICVCLLLIISRKGKVNIRLFVPFKAKESFKRNIKTELVHFVSAFRAVHVWHIASAGIIIKCFHYNIACKIGIFAVWTKIMWL